MESYESNNKKIFYLVQLCLGTLVFLRDCLELKRKLKELSEASGSAFLNKRIYYICSINPKKSRKLKFESCGIVLASLV